MIKNTTDMSESNLIKSVLEDLKSSSRSRIFNTLIKIRQDFVNKEDGLRKLKNSGGIPILISLLHKPNEKIIDIVLSILSNCCMVRECATELLMCNGIRYVVSILQNIEKDTILCRACRLIGNVAQFKPNVEKVHQFGAVVALTSIVQNAVIPGNEIISINTQLMAIRALRLLWTTNATQESMLNSNVVRAISMLLVKHTPAWLENKNSDLLIGVLRCLLHFTENPSYECVQQIAADGTGFQCLVSLINKHPYMITKCITNLYSIATTRSQLCTPEAVRSIVSRLNQHLESDLSQKWPQDELSALCLFCRHIMGREEVRSAGGLPLLLAVVRHSVSKHQKGQALHAILHFKYDETSFCILINDGLVNVLIQSFIEILKTMKCQHEYTLNKECDESYSPPTLSSIKTEDKKRSISTSKSIKRMLETSKSKCTYFKKRRFDESPSSSFYETRLSPQPSTSCCSPNCSPIRISEDDLESDDSVHYSPVCSESESEDEKSTHNIDHQEFLHMENEDSDLESGFKEDDEIKTGETRMINWVLILLSRATNIDEVDLTFAQTDTLEALLHYMQLSSQPVTRAATILFNIVSRWDYLMTLLSNNFILMLHNATKSTLHGLNCRQCNQLNDFLLIVLKKLTCIVESVYGKEKIMQELLHGGDELKEKLSIEIPFIVQSKHLLRVLFSKFEGLNNLFKSIGKTEISTRKDAVTALGLLATKLKIKDPKSSETSMKIYNVTCDSYQENNDCIVLFQLDDDSVVKAKKNILKDQSDFFNALFNGKFKESKEEVIRLRDATSDGLKYLLILIDYIQCPENDSFPLCNTLSTTLEALLLSDRYLLEDITYNLVRAIITHLLSMDTAADIYKWSIISRTGILGVETIAFGLVGDMSENERVNIFNNIINVGYKEQFFEDIRALLNRYLK